MNETARPEGTPTGGDAAAPDRAARAVRRLLVLETLGSVFWLLMDAGWMLGWPVVATLFIVPSLSTQLLVLLHTPRQWVPMGVAASVLLWLAMNVSWMLGEVWNLPALLPVARASFALAVAAFGVAFWKSRWHPEARLLLLASFRRLRTGLRPRS